MKNETGHVTPYVLITSAPANSSIGITNAAMTCSPDESNYFAVAVNCLGPVINFFRPGGKHKDSGSVHFKTFLQHFNQSKVMYSKRDEKFYITSVGGQFLVYYDAFFEEDMTGSEMSHVILAFRTPPTITTGKEALPSATRTI
ncbi:hypothetical protein Bca52824_003247 [Brassica carinata]|uniref:Uncharacterized protein n=1 Tax=Brassica carinata TaxID=52824 RepID=A0A8X8BFN6_BRACI|nr:hypothetical protein Bca52824_003247 [Brassica carinata]